MVGTRLDNTSLGLAIVCYAFAELKGRNAEVKMHIYKPGTASKLRVYKVYKFVRPSIMQVFVPDRGDRTTPAHFLLLLFWLLCPLRQQMFWSRRYLLQHVRCFQKPPGPQGAQPFGCQYHQGLVTH